MPPHTRQSQTKGNTASPAGAENEHPIPLETTTLANVNTSTRGRVPARRVVPGNLNQNQHAALGKRTYAQALLPSNTHVPTSSQTPADATKKARNVGPAHAAPMPLILPGETGIEGGNLGMPIEENGMVNQGRGDNSQVKGKGKRPERTSSFYPGRGGNHVLAHLVQGNSAPYAPEVDDDGCLSEDDPVEDELTADLALKYPNKFSESLGIERPAWLLTSGSEPENSASQSSVSVNDVDSAVTLVQPGPDMATASGSAQLLGPAQLSVVATHFPKAEAALNDFPFWPTETDLVFVSGSNRLKLTGQSPIVRSVIVEGIERLRAAMLFNDAFPDVCSALTLIKDCLLTAATYLLPGATDVLERFNNDADYLSKVTLLPRARICLIQSEVKERCTTLTVGAFLVLGSAAGIIEHVRKQLSSYTYTFPSATFPNAPNGLVMRSRPYRNECIISAIRDLYFTGGSASFARRFLYLFPTYEYCEGQINHEVPIPMVALVATALYAALYEWRTGVQQVAEFSANGYLDVYLGHVNTLKHIQEHRAGAFHFMMADIYTKANTPVVNELNTVVPIAILDLDNLDALDG
ncbi:hypothetical protein V8E53_015374 [Lactarius tabidus]